jgi:hypothetical protein
MNPLFFKQIVKELGVDFNIKKIISKFIFILKPNFKKVMHFQQIMLFSFINYQIYYDEKHSWVKSNGKQQLLTLWHKHFFRFCIKGRVLPLKHSLFVATLVLGESVRKCEDEDSHSQVSSHCGSWSLGGFSNLQRNCKGQNTSH